MSYAKYINNTVTPLALLLTGCIIHEIGLRSLRLTPTLGVMMVFRFVISPALGAALQGGGDRHIMLGPELFQVLLQPVCREPAHFHTATAGNSAGCEMEVQLRSGGFGILAVQLKEIAHLIQHKTVRIIFLDFAVLTISVRKAAALVLLNKAHKAIFALQTGLRILHRAIHQLYIPVIYPCDFKRLSVQIHSVADFISGRE